MRRDSTNASRSELLGCTPEPVQATRARAKRASVFYSHFAALGLHLVPEHASRHGRLDRRLRFNEHLWLFEFKVMEIAPERSALAEIKARGYAEQYRFEGLPIYLTGIEFSRERRGVVAFDAETLPSPV